MGEMFNIAVFSSLKCTPFYSVIYRQKERFQVHNRCASATVTSQSVEHNLISFVFEGRIGLVFSCTWKALYCHKPYSSSPWRHLMKIPCVTCKDVKKAGTGCYGLMGTRN